MYLYALIDENGVCAGFVESEEEINDSYYIPVTTRDETMVYRKKWNAETQEWVDTLPSEVNAENSRRLTHTDSDGTLHWLDNFINEVFQSASDGKTAIADAITGVDSSITIPENPTFAQLAALIGQLGGMSIATGHMQAYTSSNTTISGQTSFRPRIVAFYNNQTGSTNFNAGLYLDSDYLGLTKDAADVQEFPDINFNAWGVSGGGHAENVFTITDTGFTATVTGLCTNIGWIALG